MTIQALIKQPRSVKETGLEQELLLDLLLKHLYEGGVLNLHQLSERLALVGTVLEELLNILRKDTKVEIRGITDGGTDLRYTLTQQGYAEAKLAYARSGYIGPAPISLVHYKSLVEAQSVFKHTITSKDLTAAFDKVVISEQLFNQLGPAMHSGRAIMIYGPAGTGKTFISRKMAQLVGDAVYVPHAIAVARSVIQYFDPLVHHAIENTVNRDISFAAKTDARLVLCNRPVAMTGGELTMDMLEIKYDPATRLNQAPVQMKANNGMYIVDDLGRQRMTPMELLNRWIVPMEERRDFLTLETGKHFSVPFDTILVFSTNLHPLQLADEAFLRRLGYKIYFAPINKQEYSQIWYDVCTEKAASVDQDVLDYVFELYEQNRKELFPCHPRDLIGLGLDLAAFQEQQGRLTKTRMQLAWDAYFITLEQDKNNE